MVVFGENGKWGEDMAGGLIEIERRDIDKGFTLSECKTRADEKSGRPIYGLGQGAKVPVEKTNLCN